jgi:hypothetical protein
LALVVPEALQVAMVETEEQPPLPTLDQHSQLSPVKAAKVPMEHLIKPIFQVMVVQTTFMRAVQMIGMVVVVVQVRAALDRTVSTSAVKVVRVVLVALDYQVQFVVPQNFLVVAVVAVERPPRIQTKQMALVELVEVASAAPVVEVLASCRRLVLQTRVLVVVVVVGDLQIPRSNVLVLPVQTELLFFRIQRLQQVFQVSQ